MGGVSGKKKNSHNNRKKRNGRGSVAELQKKKNNGGIVVEAVMENINYKNKKKKEKIEDNGDETETDVEMESETEIEMQLKNIEWIFDDADYISNIPAKFNRNWRFVVSDECVGLPFSTLLTAFHQRYGIHEHLGAPSVQAVNNGRECETGSTSVDCLNTFAEDGASDSNSNINIAPLDSQLIGEMKANGGSDSNSNINIALLNSQSIGEILDRLPLPLLMRVNGGSDCNSNINVVPLNSQLIGEILARLPLPSLMRVNGGSDSNSNINITSLNFQSIGEILARLPLTSFMRANGASDSNSNINIAPLNSQEILARLPLTSLMRANGGSDSNINITPLNSQSIGEIRARLPLPSLTRAKSVCKSWNSAVGALMNVNAENYHLVAHHINQGYHGIVLFSSALNRWFRIPLQWKRWKWRLNYSRDQCSPGLGLSAVGGGLFLFVDWSSGNRFTPVVFNPLTKQHRVLPEFPLLLGYCPGMAIELIAESNHFEVITIASNAAKPPKVTPLVYSSSTNKWTPAAIPIVVNDISNTHPWTSTVHNGVVYCTNSYGLHLGCYDIDRGVFEIMEIEGGLPPLVDCLDYDKNLHANLPSLVVCSGKLVLVGRLQRSARERSILGRLPLLKHTLVGLWDLDLNAQNKSWSLVSVTPQHLLEDTVKSSDGTDFMVAALANRNKIWFILKRSTNMLTFDMSSMEWTVLPGCPAEDMMDTSPRRAFLTPLRNSPCF